MQAVFSLRSSFSLDAVLDLKQRYRRPVGQRQSFCSSFVYTLALMTAVMQNNPSLTVNDDEDDVALAAFLAPNWGRFDQDKLVSDI